MKRSLKLLFSIIAIIAIVFMTTDCSQQDPKNEQPDQHATHDAEHSAESAVPAAEEHEELPDDIVELSMEQVSQAGIAYGTIEVRAVGNTIKANGTVQSVPQAMASVSMPFGGYIKMTTLLPGASVRKGQVLATIENAEFVDIQQNYLDTKHRFEYLEGEYQRHQALFKDDVYSQKNVQQTTAEYQSLKTQLRGLEQKLTVLGLDPKSLTEDAITAILPVRAPISGNIASSNVNIGKYISATDVLFTIASTDNLMLALTLFENDARSVESGASVHFTVNNEQHEHSASVYQVGSAISSARTYTAFASVRPPCRNLLPGMYVNARIERGNRPAYVVPEESVVSFNEVSYVFVLERQKQENGKPFVEFRFVKVRKGDSRDGMTEVIPLETVDLAAAKLVVKGAYTLLSAKKNAGEMTCG